jgi:hypothetical protein
VHAARACFTVLDARNYADSDQIGLGGDAKPLLEIDQMDFDSAGANV